jgi:hypothetical protein
MISANNAFTDILVHIIARNVHAEVTMSLNMRAWHSFSVKVQTVALNEA